MSIGERVKAIKKYFRLKQDELADILGVSTTMVSKYQNNSTIPNLDSLNRILDQYPEVSSQWLFRGEGGMLKADSTENNQINNYDGGSIGVLGVNNRGTIKNTQLDKERSKHEVKIKEIKVENEKLKSDILNLKKMLEAKEDVINTQREMIEMLKNK